MPRRAHNFRDLTGQRFWRLLVLRRASDQVSPTGVHRLMWECRCDCGHIAIVRGQHLTSGATRSCGCLKAESSRVSGRKNRRHGHSVYHDSKRTLGSPEYRVWRSMKSRCNNLEAPNYSMYGGRGIRVCSEWDISIERFLADCITCNRPVSLISPAVEVVKNRTRLGSGMATGVS